MKFKSMKKVVAAVIAATMVMSSALMVCAADTGSSSSSVSGNDSSSVSGNDSATSSSSSSSSSSSDSSSDSSSSAPQEQVAQPTYEQEKSQSSNAAISVAGAEVRTSIGGVYAATSVRGTAVTTSAADVRSALGLKEGQKPVIIIYDVDPKKSVNAMASINTAADAMQADVVACLHIELGAKENGTWVTLSDGSVALKSGLPKNADKTLTYSAICVQPGGEIIVYDDMDDDPNTVTIPIKAGVNAYAIVAK